MNKVITKVVLFVSSLFILTNVFSQQQSQVQSAYIYNFTKYMQWPSAKQSGEFVIAVVGSSPITANLKVLAATKKVDAQSILVKEYGSVSQVGACHIIILAPSKSGEVSAAISKAQSSNALLITDKPGLGKKGAGMNFVVVGGKARFEINQSAIDKCKIKVNPKLASIGIKV